VSLQKWPDLAPSQRQQAVKRSAADHLHTFKSMW
jgi:hypothetical protein